MRAARGPDDDNPHAAQIAQQAYEEADDRVLCQFCGRKFNETAAKRHIPVCEQKNKANNIKGK